MTVHEEPVFGEDVADDTQLENMGYQPGTLLTFSVASICC